MTACGAQLGDPKLSQARTVLIGGPTLPANMPLLFLENGDMQLGNSIAIAGTDHFKAMVLNRLMKLGSTSSGQTLFEQMAHTGKQAMISEYAEPNSEAGPVSWQDATPAGKPVFHGAGGPVLDGAGNQLIGTGLGTNSDPRCS